MQRMEAEHAAMRLQAGKQQQATCNYVLPTP
jgi:hypothetical protein